MRREKKWEPALAKAAALFESLFDEVHQFDKPKHAVRKWHICPTGTEYETITDFGVFLNTYPVGEHFDPELAIASWFYEAVRFKKGRKVLFWRIKPEIEFFVCEGISRPSCRIYSRFAVE